MSNINREYIEEYIQGILPESDEYLKKMELYALENYIPIIEKETAQLLKVLLKICEPKNILEIGTAIGYSALVMAEATSINCNITTVEKQLDMFELAEKNIYRAKHGDRIKVINGDAVDVLPSLGQKFDLIFLDAAKGQYMQFFNNCTNLLEDGGLIISDNVLFRGMVASDELVIRRKKTIVKRLRDYLEYISNLDGYVTSVLPVGDGIALTYKER